VKILILRRSRNESNQESEQQQREETRIDRRFAETIHKGLRRVPEYCNTKLKKKKEAWNKSLRGWAGGDPAAVLYREAADSNM